jgi:hypothetical protein
MIAFMGLNETKLTEGCSVLVSSMMERVKMVLTASGIP